MYAIRSYYASREFLDQQLDQSVRSDLEEELEEHVRHLESITDERLRKSLESTIGIRKNPSITMSKKKVNTIRTPISPGTPMLGQRNLRNNFV